MARIYTMGEILVEIMRDRIDCPLDQEGSFVGPFPSGAPAIFISTAAQLGHETKIWGGVGNDRFGKMLIKRLVEDGVDCSDINTLEGRATAVAFVSYDSNGDREFIYHIDGTPAADIKFDLSNQIAPDFFHVMGCSLMVNDDVKNAIDHCVQWTVESGGKISFDPNIRPELLGNRTLSDLVSVVMENCSVFLPGVDELKLFSGLDKIEDAVSSLFSKYNSLDIIHLKKGKRGSVIYTRDEVIDIPIYPIEKVLPIVDPTGAGDSFDAAFICSLAAGKSLKESGDLAARAGAINSTVFGPMGGNQREINRDFLNE